MATTKFYLDLRGKAKDGKGSILISIFHNRTTATIPTGIRVDQSEWNGTQIIRVPGKEALNLKLANRMAEINKSIALLSIEDRFEFMTAAEIKHSILDDNNDIKSRHSISQLFIEYMGTIMADGTREIYRTTLQKIISFCGEISIDVINLKWLYEFDNYLAKTLCANSRSIYLRALRTICNYARNTGITKEYPFKSFRIASEPTQNRCIDVVTLREILYCPVSKRIEVFKDYFFLMFYLIGISSVDLLYADLDSVRNGRIEYVRKKTHKKYSIKVEPEAQELLDKYKGKTHLVDALERCQTYKGFMHEMNDSLKTIGYQDDLFGNNKPLVPGLTSYYARHTWATLAYEIGIPFDVISQALGHSSGNRTTMIYIEFDQSKVDYANRKVIDYVMQYE